ncbi:hypothetical protein NDA11_007169 [Ustilago hordei]|nr:hypothetical protein NDA11_007169 [Ustilago hordei]
MRHLQELGQSRVQFPSGDQLRNLIQLDHRLHLIFRLNLIDRHNLIRRDTPPNPFPTQTTVLLPINPLQLQKEPRHHQEAATTPAICAMVSDTGPGAALAGG